MIYLDNNATTIMPADVKKALLRWCNVGNPSAGYASASEARAMMDELRAMIGRICGFNPCCEQAEVPLSERAADQSPVCASALPKYKIIFTSGASEANCMVFHGILNDCLGRRDCKQVRHHVVMSAVEHKSLIEIAESYSSRGLADITYIQPTASGHIIPESVSNAMKPNTKLVCVMHANNETGAINDIASIAKVAHRGRAVFHCDTVQSFAKIWPGCVRIGSVDKNAAADAVGNAGTVGTVGAVNTVRSCEPMPDFDSFCISFHKLHGPPGVGALIVKESLVGRLSPIIFGAQNDGLRGGTENIPGLGASLAALRYVMNGRVEKTRHTLLVKQHIMSELAAAIPTRSYQAYVRKVGLAHPLEIIFLSGISGYLPNTILMSVVSYGSTICNGEMKAALGKLCIVVSVGAACNTSSAKASHVLYAMRADELIRKGTLRISIGDNTTLDDANRFVRVFLAIIAAQCRKK